MGKGLVRVCPAVGCRTQVPISKPMCQHHWFQLPVKWRSDVQAHYSPREHEQTPEFDAALSRCVAHLAAAP